MCETNEKPDALIRGDKFSGLCIASESSYTYQFELDGQSITVTQNWLHPTENQTILELGFNLSNPVRFRIDVLVPEDCKNACVTLNKQLLIGWFAPEIPDNLPDIITSACQDAGEQVSTLRPGQFQSINFRWFDQDLLRFYIVR